MSTMTEIHGWLQERLPSLLAENRVPGVAIAVSDGEQVIDAAAGVLSTTTEVPATVDSVFQVGSITKVWTTTLVLQLVDEQLLDLDQPIRKYLPEFRIGDEAAAAAITTRQLLCHTAGFEGDIFTDTGRGDDCVEKYVATLSELPQLFPPGAMFSYNNAGFCVLGRLVEVLRGKPFDACVRDHLITPLGLTHTANGPYEAILHRAAVGHLQPDPEQDPVAAPIWALVRSNEPAGSMLSMRPRDLLAFVAMHLNDGVAADGTRVLSAESVQAMRQPQVHLPRLGMMGDAWGLGWELFDWPGGPVIGHDGGTIGQAAFLRVVPEQNVSVALLTNGGNILPVFREIFEKVLGDLAGVQIPPLPTPPGDPQPPQELARYLGEYSCDVADLSVSRTDDGRLWLDQTPKGVMAEMGEKPERKELVGFDGDTLIAVEREHGRHPTFAFVGDDGQGRATHLHDGRAVKRVDAR